MKFGGSVYWLQSFITNPQRAKGWFRFDRRFSDNPALREDPLTDAGGSPLADFLLGASFDASGSNFVYMNLRSPFVHGYFQEDWRVSKQLTLNLGIRYEVNPPWVETRDLISNFDIDTDPDNPRIVVAGEEGTARFDRALQTTDRTNLAPRLGFAYQVAGKHGSARRLRDLLRQCDEHRRRRVSGNQSPFSHQGKPHHRQHQPHAQAGERLAGGRREPAERLLLDAVLL